jgi:hypothetical protein
MPAEDVAAIGGQFTAGGRRSATDAALPLLVTYFAGAPTWNLEVSPRLSTADADAALDEFAAAARLRASLAAAARLVDVAGRIIARPTFRYTHVAAESVGTIQGRLDLARYSRQRGRVDVPRRYPIRLVERATGTPENVLASYAVAWIKRDLERTPTGLLPAGSPEARELRDLVAALTRQLSAPLLARTVPQAMEVWRRATIEALLDRVTQRLEAGHIAAPEPYQELTDWMRASLTGDAIAKLGQRDWSFYDARFDTKLFEIWSLMKLAESISRRIGAPTARPASLTGRTRGPIYSWTVGEHAVRLYFQPPLHTLTPGGVRWRHHPEGNPLLGFPDLAVISDGPSGRGVALFDPKLRRRSGAPTEELYKLLGYFANLRHPRPPQGAILYYSPGVPTEYALRTAEGGDVRALGVDPESVWDELFDVAADIAVRSAGLDTDTPVLQLF